MLTVIELKVAFLMSCWVTSRWYLVCWLSLSVCWVPFCRMSLSCVSMLSVVILSRYTECHYADCHSSVSLYCHNCHIAISLYTGCRYSVSEYWLLLCWVSISLVPLYLVSLRWNTANKQSLRGEKISEKRKWKEKKKKHFPKTFCGRLLNFILVFLIPFCLKPIPAIINSLN